MAAARQATLRNGIRLDYAEQGDPLGTPVLLLHGVTDSRLSFAPLMPHLPPTVRAIAVSQRGHGDSDRPSDGYGPAELAADAVAFLDALGIGRAVVVGHSMGASVALRLALSSPERLLGLVLIGGRASWRDHPEITAMWKDALADLADPVDPGFVRDFQASTAARPLDAAFLDAVVAESLKLPARIWQAAFRDGVLGADDRADLGRIVAPTLILWGDRDDLTGDGQPELRERVPGARCITYRDVGHATHWEEPGRVAADLSDFVAGLTPPAPTSKAR